MTIRPPEREAPSRAMRISQWLMPRTTPLHVWAYRALHGRIVGKATGGAPVLLLTTIGRRTGEPRSVALGHLTDDLGVIVAGTNGGLERLPAWLLNLRAEPRCSVEIGSDRFEAVADFLEGQKWEQEWARLTSAYPIYDQARRLAGRSVPLVRLRRMKTDDAAGPR